MKIQILQKKLKEGLNIVEKISSKSLTLPILNNILFSTEKNFLKLTTTDLEIGINFWILAKIEKEGKITVPSRLCSSFVNLLPDKKIDLEVKNNDLIINCENYKTKVKGLSAEEFPLIPNVEKIKSISFDASLFCKNLNQIVDIASFSNSRPEISGIYFYLTKNSVITAATDSFRLGEKKLTLKKSSLNEECSFILPQKTVKELINIFGEKKGEITMFFSPNQVMFEYQMEEVSHPQIQIVSRLIEGEYPNYQEIIPKKFTTEVILNRNDFLNQIKIASLFSGKINEVRFKINPKEKKLLIFSKNPDLGEYQSSVLGKIKGEALEISFNHKFFLDGLLNINSSKVILELNGDSGPAIIKPVGDNTYIYVVMPIKTN